MIKKVFIFFLYLLYFIVWLISDVYGLSNFLAIFMLYSSGVYYVYAYIFNKEISIPGSAFHLDNKYIRILVLGVGTAIILSILLDLLGYTELFGLNNAGDQFIKMLFQLGHVPQESSVFKAS